MIREIQEIDPEHAAKDPRIVASLQDNKDENFTWYVLVDGEHVIIANAGYMPPFDKYGAYQIEIPKAGLAWMIDSLENRFGKTEAEGGLPKEQYYDITTIDGEEIKLDRLMGMGGYGLCTIDRKDSFGGLPKEHSFRDGLLFEHGLLDMFKAVAQRIAAGEI